MKAAPTLDGRIRIDVESSTDLMVMRAILHDANSAERELSERIGGDEPSDDWRDFVLPELREGFHSQLECIGRAVGAVDLEAPEPLFILRDDAETWYGGLNQARLALEDRFGLTGRHPEEMGTEERSAWIRSQFYQRLQEMILEFLMGR